MKYILAHKKDNLKIKKGAIIREEAEGKIMITATFLDTENNVVNNKLGQPLGGKWKSSKH
jgi:hypothetical protein